MSRHVVDPFAGEIHEHNRTPACTVEYTLDEDRAAFTPGPWLVAKISPYEEDPTSPPFCQILAGELDSGHSFEVHGILPEADARLIAAAPELFEAAKMHLEWIEKEHAGPQYGSLTRDTHPLGEAIWKQWWQEQLDLCAATEVLCRTALVKARGEQVSA